MESLVLDSDKRYTYADYLNWADDVRREIIDGFIQLMSPAPVTIHQRTCLKLASKIDAFIEKVKGNCEVFPAPFDVRLPVNGEKQDNEIYNIVQPDICVICDPAKIDEKGCIGAPDLIIEVLSKSTRKKDLYDKFSLYEKSGVREYWIANPKTKSITVHILQGDGKYDGGTEYIKGEHVPVHIFSDTYININQIFKD